MPDLFRREAECDFLFEGIGVDGDGAVVMRFLPRLKNSGTVLPFMPESLQGQIEFEFTAAKGEFRRAELGDAHVGEAFGFADADGEDRHGDGGAIERFHFAVGDAVAENDDAGLRAAPSRAARCSELQ